MEMDNSVVIAVGQGVEVKEHIRGINGKGKYNKN